MTKVQNFAGLSQSLPFTEFDFYELYRRTFENTELGRMKRLLPLHEMAESFGLVNKSLAPKRGRKSYFTPEGKVALMFLKMYTQLSAPKLMEQLNANVHYQIFCDIYINPERPLTNYKLLDDIVLELAGGLKIQELQNKLSAAWKPYMKDLDTMYMDATCYEREHSDSNLLTDKEKKFIDIITTAYLHQKNHFESNDPRESVPNRIVSIAKPYVRPIVRGKEVKKVGGHQLCQQRESELLQGEWHPDIVREERSSESGEEGEMWYTWRSG